MFCRRGYPNDLRIIGDTAYLTESGTGAILVLNLQTGAIRRLLSNSSVTKADPLRIPVAEGREMRRKSGEVFRVQADAIELSPMANGSTSPPWTVHCCTVSRVAQREGASGGSRLMLFHECSGVGYY